jgi:hypothetical protein
MTDFQEIQLTNKRAAFQRKNAKQTPTALKDWYAKSTSTEEELALIHAKSCLVQIQKNAKLLMVDHSACAKKDIPKIS